MKTSIHQAQFKSTEKIGIRNFILSSAQKGNSFLDFWGNGETYKEAKKRKINVTSIDNGSSHIGKYAQQKLKKNLKGKNKIFTNFRDYCETLDLKKQHDTIWLDYCACYSNEITKDIRVASRIMKKEGTLFITLQTGREKIMVTGTQRKVVNKVILGIIKEEFKETGVKLKRFFTKVYLSNLKRPGKKGNYSKRMTTHGFTWTKI